MAGDLLGRASAKGLRNYMGGFPEGMVLFGGFRD